MVNTPLLTISFQLSASFMTLALFSSVQATSAQTSSVQTSNAQTSSAQSQAAGLEARVQLEELILDLERGGIPKGTAEVSVYFPPRKEPIQSADKLPRLGLIGKLIRQNFELSTVTAEKFLGREVNKLELKPKLESASSWNFWIDAQWSTPLAFEQRDFEGKLIRRAAYTALLEQKVPKRRSQPKPILVRPSLEKRLEVALKGFAPPQGFRAVSIKRSKRGELQTLEMTFSDGLNTFPLILTTKGTKAAEGIAVRKLGPVWLWMVGRFPKSTLEGTLASVKGSVDVEGLGTFVDSGNSN